MAAIATLVLARCTVLPTFLIPTSSQYNPVPGGTVTYEVGVYPTPTSDQVVNISTNSSSSFSSLPSTATVLAGHSSVEFSATLSQNPSQSFTTYAACNGTSTDCTVHLYEPKNGKK